MNLFSMIFYIYLWIDYSTTSDWTSSFKLTFAIISTPGILYEFYYILGLRFYLVKYLLNNSIDYLIPGLFDFLYEKYYDNYFDKTDLISVVFKFFVCCDEGHFNCYLNFKYMVVNENHMNRLEALDNMKQLWSVNSNNECSFVNLRDAKGIEEIYIFNNRNFRYIDPPDTKNLYENVYESKGNFIKSNLLHKIKLRNHMLREGFQKFHTVLRFSHYDNIDNIVLNKMKYQEFMFTIKNHWDDELFETIEFFDELKIKREKDKLSELACFESYIIIKKEEKQRVYIT